MAKKQANLKSFSSDSPLKVDCISLHISYLCDYSPSCLFELHPLENAKRSSHFQSFSLLSHSVILRIHHAGKMEIMWLW